MQRGVLISEGSNILEQVRSVAGKSLVEEASSVPPQLMAGSCMIAGKVAEKLASQEWTSTQQNLSPLQSRCRDVDDLRFLALVSDNPSFRLLAEAYFLRAATLFQPEIPQMWKKAWDCHSSPVSWQAITAVSQLCRIAKAKNNHKRVIELSLILVDCHLDEKQPSQDDNDDKHALQLVQTYRPKDTPRNPIQKALEILSQVKAMDPFEDEASTVYEALLQYRVARADRGSEDSASIIQKGNRLQDIYLQGDAIIPEPHGPSLCQQLQSHLEWMSHAELGWAQIASFVKPLAEYWTMGQNREDRPTCLESNDLIIGAALLLPTVEWMLLESGPQSSVDCLLWVETTLKTKMEATILSESSRKVIGTTKVNPVVERCRVAMDTIQALLVLRGQTDRAPAVSERATAKKSRSLDYGREYGFSFLEFLVCWSGLHQHPWTMVTQAEARLLVSRAQACLKSAQEKMKRPITDMERALLQLGQADADGSGYDSGFGERARKLYQSSADSSSATNSPSLLLSLIKIRSQAGLADVALKENDFANAIAAAKQSLDLVEDADLTKQKSSMWVGEQFAVNALQFQKADTQRLLANVYLRSGEVAQAQGVLEQAVQDSPNDAGANFALGSFRLYRSIFLNSGDSVAEKEAQVQLLRAAKMDSSRPGPFALLGFWYERKGDTKRALGCYSKALVLDPSHPVAGRGVIRLAPSDTLDAVFDKAVKVSSSSIGWAWHQIGLRKALHESQDELAVVALLKTLRCRDIERPESDLVAPFFSNPSVPEVPNKKDMASTLTDLALCYRRLGRYTAAVRSFHSAISLCGDEPPPRTLCSCAQVELELGLLDDAEMNFKKAAETAKGNVLTVSTYGRISAILLMARRNSQDGKMGSAFALLMAGIEASSDILGARLVGIHKVVADLYSFAATLPADLFGDQSESTGAEECIEKQVAFVANAEQFYLDALDMTEDKEILVGLLADIGSNRLVRAQLQSAASRKGLNRSIPPDVNDLFLSAADSFRLALDTDPQFAPAWCGLGCSVVHSDRLLAQHAFVRSLELDNLAPDTYSNLSFLYTKERRFVASSKVSDLLSEVADTPMMWINRAAILESGHGKDVMQQACDAYNAALQVAKHPTALIGLAMTCRQNPSMKDPIAQSVFFMMEYLGVSGQSDIATTALMHAQNIELLRSEPDDREASCEELATLGDQIALEDESGAQDGIPLRAKAFHLVANKAKGSGVVLSKSEPIEYSLQRQVVNDPSNGSVWLQLSKELVTQSAMEPSLVAARRASSLLSARLLQPQTTPGQRYVDANELSDSLALKYWLESVSGSNENGVSKSDPADVQRSLLMNPGNAVARQVLQASR